MDLQQLLQPVLFRRHSGRGTRVYSAVHLKLLPTCTTADPTSSGNCCTLCSPLTSPCIHLSTHINHACTKPPPLPPQAKFGIPTVALSQLEIYTTAVLLATINPPPPPKFADWRRLMDRLGEVSCASYRGVVFQHPHFIPYFSNATPQEELGNLNIGSRPARRKKVGYGQAGLGTVGAVWLLAFVLWRRQCLLVLQGQGQGQGA